MKKFKFKLQTVLDFRIKQLDEAQQAFAREEHQRQLMIQRIAECDQVIEGAIEDQQARMTSGEIDISHALQFPQFLLRLKQQRAEEYQKLKVQEEIILFKRNELKEAIVKKKSLEILKQKAQKAFDTKVLKMEEDMLSEISLNKIARRIIEQHRQQEKRTPA
ncbi:MAG: hypothetical protein VKJ04_09440 [Vampirovibrionales bacterium]|nr:hypothetical protein [Vampirovibrionales bacterium]